jgi:hypothetical protein
MDSQLKELLGAARRNRQAQKALREFEPLFPYIEELRDRGVLARHPC